jgi:hypothetical protein
MTHSGPAAKKDGAAQQRFVDSPNGTYGTSGWIAKSVKLDISAPNHRGHLSVSSVISLPNPAGVIGIGAPPKLARSSFILGSARAALISALRVHRAIVAIQRRYREPPDLSRSNSASKWR